MKSPVISAHDVVHIASLSKISITTAEEHKFAEGFNATLSVIAKLFDIEISSVDQTHQVTELLNIYREDEVDVHRVFTQAQALANAPRKYNGFFVVNQIIDQE